MKKQWVIFACSLLVSLFSLNASDVAASKSHYVQLSSRQDQLATIDEINKGIVVILENMDGIEGMGFDTKTNEVSIQEEGVYFCMAVAQVGAREYVGGIVKGGDVYFWLERNRKAIENSGSWVFASPTSRSHTIVDQLILSCKKGDLIRCKFATSSPSMGLITFAATEKWPAAPGITLSIYKMN